MKSECLKKIDGNKNNECKSVKIVASDQTNSKATGTISVLENQQHKTLAQNVNYINK